MAAAVPPPEVVLEVRKKAFDFCDCLQSLEYRVFPATLKREGRSLDWSIAVGETVGAFEMKMTVANFHVCGQYYIFITALMILQRDESKFSVGVGGKKFDFGALNAAT